MLSSFVDVEGCPSLETSQCCAYFKMIEPFVVLYSAHEVFHIGCLCKLWDQCTENSFVSKFKIVCINC